MTFTARERFIYYITSAMTMRGMRMIDDIKMKRIMSLILENRCRKLTKDDTEQIYRDIEEEVVCSGPVFDRSKKRKKELDLEDWKYWTLTSLLGLFWGSLHYSSSSSLRNSFHSNKMLGASTTIILISILSKRRG